jgi:hypothetical protein
VPSTGVGALILHNGEVVEASGYVTATPGEPPEVLQTTPCAPPEGGWRPGQVDESAVRAYLDQHADRFNGFGFSGDVHVAVVGVSAGDVAQAQTELRSRFGENLCAVRVDYTTDEQRRANEALQALMAGPDGGIYFLSGYPGFEPIIVGVTFLDQRRYESLREIGLNELSVNVWLKPVR